MSDSPTMTKSVVAYNLLKERLRDGAFGPGERLTEVKLAKSLNLNRSAIREAMLRLEGEGFLVGGGAYGGKYVRYMEDHDQTDVLAHYELREAIEGLAARLAARNMNAWQVDELRRLDKRIVKFYEAGNRAAQTDAVADFFRYLLANCGNPLFLQVWEAYYLMPFSQRSQEFEDDINNHIAESERPERTLKPVIDAIALRDPDEAERCMRERVRRITEVVRQINWSKIDR